MGSEMCIRDSSPTGPSWAELHALAQARGAFFLGNHQGSLREERYSGSLSHLAAYDPQLCEGEWAHRSLWQVPVCIQSGAPHINSYQLVLALAVLLLLGGLTFLVTGSIHD